MNDETACIVSGMTSLLLASLLAGAASGGVAYEAVTERTSPMGPSTTRETVRVVGAKSRAVDASGQTTVCDRSLDSKPCRVFDDATRAWWYGGADDAVGVLGARMPGAIDAPTVKALDVKAHDDGAAPAVDGIPVRRLALRVSFALHRNVGGFPVTSKVEGIGTFLVAEGPAVEALLPHERLDVRLGLPEVDAAVRRELGASPRVALHRELQVTERFDEGTPRSWSSKRSVTRIRAGTGGVSFEVPSGYRLEAMVEPGRKP